MTMILSKRSKLLSTPASYYVISGETITGNLAAERLGISRALFDQRKRAALKKPEPNQILTWEILPAKKT